jgi:hypothetical protein
VRGPVTRFSPRGRQDAGAQSRSQHTGLLPGMIGVQSLQSVYPRNAPRFTSPHSSLFFANPG